ncbi:single-stranded DNA-binding protein [Winkia sp. UMB3158]|uniref:single-stranded DNA-binding protein n=1 Tax=unclassified Winkia TaxID=2692119 RepID=UPI002552722C|nr:MULTISPECIES: single-stranded DNA-binding protein [unclassified Winkia]MDK7150509.1 single-stranded DNA-binding protein [Winkia sp. UMB3158]MDK7906644.1 single-stranded DNA-binding protein [Winkia sp. UMB0889B]MDK8342150.1 single-stranded DNA-binding protein [Winkia sp. UMB3164B]MDK8566085.1 single-stranded DNA-binding protein [Winkia sp. UMB3164A]
MAGDTVITVVGNLTADPELRFTASGAPVASFTIASTPRRYNRQSGQWEDGEALFMRCSLWRQAAENAADSLQKGMRVIAQGRLQQRSYETREGEKRTVVEMQVDEIGPSLTFATARVERSQRGGSGFGGGQGGYGGGQQNQGGYGVNQGQPQNYGQPNQGQGFGSNASYNAPTGGSPEDPWSTGGAQAGSSFDDAPPF